MLYDMLYFKADFDCYNFFLILKVISFEVFHVAGIAILTFIVLPRMDTIKAAMIFNAVCFLPAVLSK